MNEKFDGVTDDPGEVSSQAPVLSIATTPLKRRHHAGVQKAEAQCLSMQTDEESKPLVDMISIEKGAYRWCVSSALADPLIHNGVDWFHLENHPGAILVKQNSHRDVWHVACGVRAYYAKLYHPRGILARMKHLARGSTALREWDVGNYAAAHHIATVKPVATALQGYRGLKGASLLITEAIPNVLPLNKCWLCIGNDRQQSDCLIESMARLIARAHQCGFRHGDMHPENILVRQSGQSCEVLFCDLHNVRTARPVSPRDVIANLAQLNQWFRRHSTRTQRRRFLNDYLIYRDRFGRISPFAQQHTYEIKRLVAQLAISADRHAHTLWTKRDRRTLRTGRYFTRLHPAFGWRGHALLRTKHPSPAAQASLKTYTLTEWESWLREPTDWIDPGRHQLIKDSHTVTLCKAVLPCTDNPPTVIVKRPIPRNSLKRLSGWFGLSRNMRAWRTAYMLLNRDLPVAQPLAVVERYVLRWIRVDSISFTDYVPDSVDLETYLTRDVASQPQTDQRRIKDGLISAVVHLLKAFHNRGFVHRDFKAPNLLVSWKPDSESPVLTFIDMDGIKFVRRSTQKQRERALARLCVSLLGSPGSTRSDRLRFLKQTLTGPGRTPDDWKVAWRRLDQQVHHKQFAKASRREWKLAHYGRE